MDRMIRKTRVEKRGPTRDGTTIGTLLIETPSGLFHYRQSLHMAGLSVGMGKSTPSPSFKTGKFDDPEAFGYEALDVAEAAAIAEAVERHLGDGLYPKRQIKPIEPNGERDGSRLVGGRFRP